MWIGQWSNFSWSFSLQCSRAAFRGDATNIKEKSLCSNISRKYLSHDSDISRTQSFDYMHECIVYIFRTDSEYLDLQPSVFCAHRFWKGIIQKKMSKQNGVDILNLQVKGIPKCPRSKKSQGRFLRNRALKIASYVCSGEIEKSDFFRKSPKTPI